MPTVDVRLDELARDTEGMSPADLKALSQEAGLAAMGRGEQSVAHEDFTEALARMRAGAVAQGASY
jgi:ATP-dependent 26S proteasome regulatory subunit